MGARTGVAGLWIAGIVLGSALILPGEAWAQEEGRLFGRVLTRSGDLHEGYIRWDLNEAGWADFLHGAKPIPEQNYEDAVALLGEDRRRQEETLELFGVLLSWDGGPGSWPDAALSAIRFGHLRSVEILDGERALLVLKSGLEVEMISSSTDLGQEIRGVQVEAPGKGVADLEWDDLQVVDFSAPTGAGLSQFGTRLYGTVTTRWGGVFTGFVAWDADEVFTADLLNGRQDGRDREIPFRDIRSIERDGRSGARVTLGSGEVLELRGSNDVNDENRGIVVADPAMGQVTVGWDEFERLDLQAPPTEEIYSTFDGGRSLYGDVTTNSGEVFTGYLRWDNDEEFTWEVLDGFHRGVEFDIEFSRIRSIQRLSSSRAKVTLLDGRSFVLEDSNDVNEGNKGVFVIDDSGEVRVVVWDSLDSVTFRYE